MTRARSCTCATRACSTFLQVSGRLAMGGVFGAEERSLQWPGVVCVLALAALAWLLACPFNTPAGRSYVWLAVQHTYSLACRAARSLLAGGMPRHLAAGQPAPPPSRLHACLARAEPPAALQTKRLWLNLDAGRPTLHPPAGVPISFAEVSETVRLTGQTALGLMRGDSGVAVLAPQAGDLLIFGELDRIVVLAEQF